MISFWLAILLAVAGTLVGDRLLKRVPKVALRKVVAAIISLLGISLLVNGL